MSKFIFMAALVAFSFGCGNNEANDTTNSDDNDTGSTMMQGVENVNGNIPDTSNLGGEPITNTDPDSVGSPR